VIALVEAVEEVVEVAAGVAPVDGFGVGLPVGLEGVDAPGEGAGAPSSRRPRVSGEILGAERGVESLFGKSERVGSDCSLVTARARAARAAVVMAFVVLYVFCTIKTVGFSLPSNMKTFQ
jgi:hypothetical protein